MEVLGERIKKRFQDEFFNIFNGIENATDEQIEKIKDLRNRIVLKDDNYDHIHFINSYAYALGLDVDVKEVNPAAYEPGLLGAAINRKNIDYVRSLSMEDRLFFDLESLGIEYMTVPENDKSLCNIDKDGFLSWMIALYDRRDYRYGSHFLRKTPNGNWIYKDFYGIRKYDDNHEPILSIADFGLQAWNNDYEEYELIDTYKLRLKK